MFSVVLTDGHTLPSALPSSQDLSRVNPAFFCNEVEILEKEITRDSQKIHLGHVIITNISSLS